MSHSPDNLPDKLPDNLPDEKASHHKLDARLERVLDQAEQQLLAAGRRLTAKRRQVLSGLLHSPKALSAYELVAFCHTLFGATIPVMSVYRILSFLEAERLVHKLHLANKYVACAHISCDHSHGAQQFLICGRCSKVAEISLAPAMIAEVQSAVAQKGFQLASPQLELDCVCSACTELSD